MLVENQPTNGSMPRSKLPSITETAPKDLNELI
jgi:hypothetical protein